MRAGHVGRWRELPSLAQAALQQPRTGPGGPEGTRGYSNPHCHSTMEADWLRESHRQPGLPVWLATHSLRRVEARHLTPSPAPCGLTRANDDSAPVQVMGSVFTGMLRKTWHVKKNQKTNHQNKPQLALAATGQPCTALGGTVATGRAQQGPRATLQHLLQVSGGHTALEVR